MFLLVSKNFRKNNINNRIHNTNGISGLAYLEYWIHNGIEDNEKTAIKAAFLLEIFNPIKYVLIKQRKEHTRLGSLNANSLGPNNLIDNAINQ